MTAPRDASLPAAQPPPSDNDPALGARFDEVVARVLEYHPEAQLDLLHSALAFARKAHDGQLRYSGEPYIYHPIAVARIVADLRMDLDAVAAALMHDVLEDAPGAKDDMMLRFGRDITEMVDGVTKLSAVTDVRERASKSSPPQDLPAAASEAPRSAAQVENLRKIFLVLARDVRVILVKLADRLHNLRTLEWVPPNKRRRVARETLEIFAPIASRLGLWKLKPELEDLAFRHLYPDDYSRVSAQVGEVRAQRERMMPELLGGIRARLDELGIAAQIEWRPKHLYSVWRKMSNQGKDLSDLHDLLAVRLIVETQEDCYSALGAIHATYTPLKDRIKDYIAVPKANRYRSLHTTILGPGDEPIELQIRTLEMHSVNEFGIAAHWAYKQGKEASRESTFTQDILPWVKLVLDWQDERKDARGSAESLKLDLLSTEVFVFTPQGDVIDLPAGSTPLDFAYRVHTMVGHRCVGARVNTRMVPIDYLLKTADVVDVITSKHGTPSLDWLRICKTNGARNKIRTWFKKERREENIERGTDLLSRELRRLRYDGSTNDDSLTKVAQGLNFGSVLDMLAAIGYSEITASQVATRLKESCPERFPAERPKVKASPRGKARKANQGVIVSGMGDMLVKLSRCCNPVHGDDISGFVSLGKGVAVHLASCSNFQAHLRAEPARKIQVAWEGTSNGGTYPVDLDVEATNRNDLLADVLGVVNECKIPVRACNARVRRDHASIRLGVDIVHRQQLDDLIKRLQRVRSVVGVERATQGAGG